MFFKIDKFMSFVGLKQSLKMMTPEEKTTTTATYSGGQQVHQSFHQTLQTLQTLAKAIKTNPTTTHVVKALECYHLKSTSEILQDVQLVHELQTSKKSRDFKTLHQVDSENKKNFPQVSLLIALQVLLPMQKSSTWTFSQSLLKSQLLT
jgi:hypothetical protein